MKNIILLTSLLIFITSCENEPVDFYQIDNNDYTIALDTLRNYNDYILGDFGENFIVSTSVFTKGYGALITGIPIDSSKIDFNIGYKLLENNIEKTVFVTYNFLEANTKLDTTNSYKYKHFSDFVDSFDRNQLVYYQNSQPANNLHSIRLIYKNHYTMDEDIYTYNSADYNHEITPENFNFYIDSINVSENPIKKVEVYYSFKCIGVNSYDDELIMKNGKGKSTFEY